MIANILFIIEAIRPKKGGIGKFNFFCGQHGEQTRMQMRQNVNNGVGNNSLMQTRKVIKWLFVIDRYFALSFKGTLRFVLSFIKNEGTRNKFCASLDKNNVIVVVRNV